MALPDLRSHSTETIVSVKDRHPPPPITHPTEYLKSDRTLYIEKSTIQEERVAVTKIHHSN